MSHLLLLRLKPGAERAKKRVCEENEPKNRKTNELYMEIERNTEKGFSFSGNFRDAFSYLETQGKLTGNLYPTSLLSVLVAQLRIVSDCST